MPRVTVQVIGGDQKENLESVTIAQYIWGVGGVQWGDGQNVAPGNDIPAVAHYSRDRFFHGNTNIPNVPTFDVGVIADGPANTRFILIEPE